MIEHCSQATVLNEWCFKSHSLPHVTGWSFNRVVLPPRGRLLTLLECSNSVIMHYNFLVEKTSYPRELQCFISKYVFGQLG